MISWQIERAGDTAFPGGVTLVPYRIKLTAANSDAGIHFSWHFDLNTPENSMDREAMQSLNLLTNRP